MFVWVDHPARIEEFFFWASDHDRDFIHVLIGKKITTDRVMNNSTSNKSSTQPLEKTKKKSETKQDTNRKLLMSWLHVGRTIQTPRIRAWPLSSRRSCPHTRAVLSTYRSRYIILNVFERQKPEKSPKNRRKVKSYMFVMSVRKFDAWKTSALAAIVEESHQMLSNLLRKKAGIITIKRHHHHHQRRCNA